MLPSRRFCSCCPQALQLYTGPMRQNVLKVILVAMILSPCGYMYIEGRRPADALCEIAPKGASIERVIAAATQRDLPFADDRQLRGEPNSRTGYLASLAHPFTMRRTCQVWFTDGIVVRTENRSINGD